MSIIDLHVHLGDIFCGHNSTFHVTARPKLAHLLPQLNEILNFYLLHNSFLRKLEDPKSAWNFTMDCVGMSEVGNLSKSIDKTKIDYACVLALEPHVKTHWVIEQVKREPRIVPILSIHPEDNITEEKVNEYIRRGCKGMKLHPVIQGFSPKSEKVFDLIGLVRPHGIPIICHTGCFPLRSLEGRKEYGNIENFIPLIQKFHEVPFIMCHMNLFHSEEAISIAKRYENVYLETSWQTPKNIRRAISAIGSERVVFGSDWPYASQSSSLAVVRKACGSDRSLQNVFYSNARRLLRLTQDG